VTRILVITNMYPPHHLGGYELWCHDVVERWRGRGHEVSVLTTTMRLPGIADPPAERERVFRDLEFYWEDHRLRSPSLPRRVAIERANRAAIDRALERVRPDVVSAWAMGAMSLGLLTRVLEQRLPLVVVVCDEWLVYAPDLDAWTRIFRRRPVLGRAVRRLTGLPTSLPSLRDKAVALYVSDYIRRRSESGSSLAPKDAAVVYCGIDRSDLDAGPGVRPRPWRWRLLYCGRLDERKGLHTAVEALALLPPDATLEVIGRGDPEYRARLDSLVTRLGLDGRVRFDVAAREALGDRYRASDVVVFPTIWEEPFGLVPVEAMACGTPVVATGTGGSGEFLADEANCLLVPPADPAALAAAVTRLAGDEELCARLIEGGLRTAEELDIDRVAPVIETWHVAAAVRFAGGRPAVSSTAAALLARAEAPPGPAPDG
jgi:glycosyltransferase involved in cell wall biosynthesis